MTKSVTRGAYGYKIPDLLSVGELLPESSGTWPTLRIIRSQSGPPPPPHNEVDDDRARIPLSDGGFVGMDRVTRTATVVDSALSQVGLLHPMLAMVTALFAHWDGRDTFHAGCVVLDGGAWGVMGQRKAGKSTLLAYLASQGFSVVADDMVSLDGGKVHAGPRFIDLRSDVHESLALSVELESPRPERKRLLLPSIQSEFGFRGWLQLCWGEEVMVDPVPIHERFSSIASQRIWLMPSKAPAALLDVVSLPCYRVRRPRALGALDETVSSVLAVVDSRHP